MFAWIFPFSLILKHTLGKIVYLAMEKSDSMWQILKKMFPNIVIGGITPPPPVATPLVIFFIKVKQCNSSYLCLVWSGDTIAQNIFV